MTPLIDCVTVGSLFVELTPSTPGDSLVSARDYTLVAGGAAANVVFALARLGVGVSFITAVGDDEFGTLLLHELAAFGIDTAPVRRVSGQLTPVTFSAIDQQGGKTFRFYRFPEYAAPMDALRAEDFSPCTHGRLFDFSEGSIREGHLRALVFAAARQARSAGAAVLYAVNLRKSSWRCAEGEIRVLQREAVRLADIVVLNAEEVSYITGWDGEEGMAALQELGPRVVVMTCGGDGDMLVRVDADTRAIPPYQVPVVYDVGAGDTFHAGLVAAALRHATLSTLTIADWADAVQFAGATAALRVATSADPHALRTSAQVTAWMAAQK
ncbi:MAG TPA: PfkB family carbohydrate kinase [Armatimonadota bacterium]|jgi:sugar/nucleoside kinase (ribokinase family)